MSHCLFAWMKGVLQMSQTNNLDKTTYTRLSILLIAIGALIAIDSFMEISIIHKLWPLLITTLGSGLIGIFIKRRTTGNLYLAAGEYLVCFSGLALYFNFTSWNHIARIWPLFILFLGIVFLTLFLVNRKKRSLLLVGLVLASISIVFLFVFTLNMQYWWTIFILIGISLLVSVHTK